MNRARTTSRSRARRAFTLVEAVVCTLVVAILFLVAVQAVGMSATIQFKAAERARSRALATALLDEIVQQKYASTSTSPIVFDLIPGDPSGPKAGNRLGFDDVDDYQGYSDQPPQDRDGTKINGVAEYRREVAVTPVDPLDPSKLSVGDTGLKRITVTVIRNRVVLARATALRANVP